MKQPPRSRRAARRPTRKPEAAVAESAAKRSRIPLIVVCALAAAFLAQSLSSSLRKSATFDEPMHITAGLSYIATGRIVVSPDHPPLLKELSALSLRSAGVRWPASPEAARVIKDEVRLPSALARSIVVENGPDHVMFWARLPLMFVATALVFVVYMLGRRLVGETAAVGAAFLCAFDPNILAHSYLVTTDAGLATFLVLFIVAFWDFVDGFSFRRAIICGIALGVALGAKYSAVVLLPLAALLMLASVRWTRARGGGVTERRVDQVARLALGFVAMCVVAFLVIEVIYVFPKDPIEYVRGFGNIYGGHVEDGEVFQAYMAGRLAPRFYSYYVVAFLLKEPIASIVLASIGLAIVIRSKSIPPLARAFLIAPPVLLVAGYTVMSFGIGIRYIIPALPFSHLLGGVALAALVRSARLPARVAGGALAAWVVIAAAGIYPDHLSYFNEAACVLDDPAKLGLDGGSRCGPEWLDDSNVDWGQGLKQLKQWLDTNAPGRPVRLGYFGTVPPAAYGIQQTPMTDEDLLFGKTPGLYAVSAHIVASTPAVAKRARGSGAEWLRTTRPIAIVGHAFYVFDIGASGSK